MDKSLTPDPQPLRPSPIETRKRFEDYGGSVIELTAPNGELFFVRSLIGREILAALRLINDVQQSSGDPEKGYDTMVAVLSMTLCAGDTIVPIGGEFVETLPPELIKQWGQDALDLVNVSLNRIGEEKKDSTPSLSAV